MNMLQHLLFSSLLLSSLFLAACGGGSSGSGSDGASAVSYNGNSEPATIDDTNAEEIGKAAGEAVLKASSSTQLPTGSVISEDIDLSAVDTALIDIAKDLISQGSGIPLPSGVDVSQICTGGGSADSNIPSTSGRSVTKITYKNCTITSGSSSFTIDGTVVMTYDDFSNLNAGFSVVYKNVTVSGIANQSVTLNYTFSCTNLSDYNTCTKSSIFKASDGQSHQISNYQITGSSTNGYNGTATFSHYTYGTVTITITGITYGQCGGQPDGGSISFTSTNSSSGTITFNSDCSVTGSWNAITATSASF